MANSTYDNHVGKTQIFSTLIRSSFAEMIMKLPGELDREAFERDRKGVIRATTGIGASSNLEDESSLHNLVDALL